MRPPLEIVAMNQKSVRGTCCSTSASMGYWFLASILAWGLLSLLGLYWHPLGPISASTILLAVGIGCAANWSKNRVFHCGITAPLFLVAGTATLLSDLEIIHAPPHLVELLVLVGTVTAFILERNYARTQRLYSSSGKAE